MTQTPLTVNNYNDAKTDYNRWRLRDERGQQIWDYVSEEEAAKRHQSIAEKYFLGRDTGQPKLPKAKTALQAAKNGLEFFSKLQTNLGNWSCEYGGPVFLLSGMVLMWYATQTPIPEYYKIEIRSYLFARQNPADGGWGLHIEGESSVYGCVMNYITLRICDADPEDPRMIKARGKLHKLGGPVYGPHWAKFWLSILGLMKWEIVNPVPPELWLLPDWTPIAPWRWWIHMRQVFLPMSYIWSKRWVMPETQLIRELRQEIFTQSYETIDFASHRNSIAVVDNYHPKTWILNTVNWLLVYIWVPYFRTAYIIKKAEEWVWWLLEAENINTDYSDLAPVSGPMNVLCTYIHDGATIDKFRHHLSRQKDYLWINDEGLFVNGTNGMQSWDTAWTIQACVHAGLDAGPEYHPMLVHALEYLESQQILSNCADQEKCYRHPRKGAWGFSTKGQGYTVSDCTAEALSAVLALQHHASESFPRLVSDQRLFDAADILLTCQNASTGGCSSYEPARGSEKLEWLNAAEVFGRIMVEYDYVECTTAVVLALQHFKSVYPEYRRSEIDTFIHKALEYIRSAQREDGSWYGSWGICFTYTGMFALSALASVGENYNNSARVRKAVEFFLDRQMNDGGWSETYRSCETGVYTPHVKGQVVMTSWVMIGLIECGFDDVNVLKRAAKMIVERQQDNGEWLQEGIEGVFNKSW